MLYYIYSCDDVYIFAYNMNLKKVDNSFIQNSCNAKSFFEAGKIVLNYIHGNTNSHENHKLVIILNN